MPILTHRILPIALSCLIATVGCNEFDPASKSASEEEVKAFYGSLKIKNARVVGDIDTQNDIVTVAYELVNTSDTRLQVPVDKAYSRHLAGVRQHWIERKGDDNTLPLGGKRVDRKYAAGGTIIPCGPLIEGGHSFEFEEKISIKNFPAGQFVYFIDFQAPGAGTLQIVEVNFELTDN